jgi:hypothetical protein
MNKTDKIDFVLLWVDGSNLEWLARYKQYRTEEHIEDVARFRDWGLLPYWFRAVERYAPWVNKIYFVTSGELPTWLNLNHPKLVHVKHEDFIPAKYLPTFSANTIELNLHLIPGLSEHFVYFNDDMFLNGPVEQIYFFKKGLPCDAPCESFFSSLYYGKHSSGCTALMDVCNVGVLNGNFNRYRTIKQSPYRWFGLYLGFWNIISAIIISRFERFQRFRLVHQAQPFLKSVYQDAWNNDFGWLDKTCSYKFRQNISVNQWFLRYWQLARNNFYPKRHKDRLYINLQKGTCLGYVKQALLNEHIKCICLNDTPECDDAKYHELQPQIVNIFESKLPNKSKFER